MKSVKSDKKVRKGWAEASKQIAALGDDALVWAEFANKDDAVNRFNLPKGIIIDHSDPAKSASEDD